MWWILLPHVASTTVSGNQLRWAGLEHARWLYTSGDLGGSGLTGWLAQLRSQTRVPVWGGQGS